jgi:polyhydroxybutyrate depolymerase
MYDWSVSRIAGLTLFLLGSACGSAQLAPEVDMAEGTSRGPDPGDLGLPDDLAVPPGPRCTGKAGAPGDQDRMISAGGRDRRYLLHVPTDYDPTVPMPLVLAFHGFTASPEDMRDQSHYNDIGDQRGFIVAYPAGVLGSWNAGACCGAALTTMVDDLGFVEAVLDELEDTLCIDPHRVYASGFSNGGFLSHRLGCELSDRIAAIGVVSGQEAMASCTPSRPVPVVQVHGTSDPVVPYDGNPFLHFPATLSTIDGWAMRDGCASTTKTLSSDGDITCVGRDGCMGGSDVVLCTRAEGGHEWVPTGDKWMGGMPPAGFNATEYFADFFAAHPMP